MRRTRAVDSGMRDRKGVTLVMVAMMIVMLVAFVGIGIDLSRLYAYKAQLQTTADASAMAAVIEVMRQRPLAATDTALAYAARNRVELNPPDVQATDVVPGSWDFATETFTPTPGGSWTAPLPAAVQVTARYPTAMTFARVISGPRTLVAQAVGAFGYGGSTECLKPWAIYYQSMLDALYPPKGSKPVSYELTDDDIKTLAAMGSSQSISLLMNQSNSPEPGNILAVQVSDPWNGNSTYKQVISGPGCSNMSIGPGKWLDGDPGEGSGQTGGSLFSFCDANGGARGSKNSNFTCVGEPKVKLAIWDISNTMPGGNFQVRVKYVGVFAITGFTSKKNKVTGVDDDFVQGYFSSMATTGSISSTPSPIKVGILVQ